MIQDIKDLLKEEKAISVAIIITLIADVLTIIGIVLMARYYGELNGDYGSGFTEWSAKYVEARSVKYTDTHLYLIIFLLHIASFITVYVRNCMYEKRNIISGALGIGLTVVGFSVGFINVTVAAILCGGGMIAIVVSCIFFWISTEDDASRPFLVYWIISILATCVIIPFITTVVLAIAVIVGIILLAVFVGRGEKDRWIMHNTRTGETFEVERKD